MNLLLVLVAALAGGRLAPGAFLAGPYIREGVVPFTQERDLSAYDEVVGLGRVSEPIATTDDTIVVAD